MMYRETLRFGSPIPLVKRKTIDRLVVQRRRLGGVLARSLVVGCPRHHRVGSTAWRVTFMCAIGVLLLGPILLIEERSSVP